MFNPVLTSALSLVIIPAHRKVLAEETSNYLYNDEHFHIQNFKADGPRLSEVLKMMINTCAVPH
jgi:hypothetical protein